jgi:hypothetical protein
MLKILINNCEFSALKNMAETGLITAISTAGALIFLAAICGASRARRYSAKAKMAQVAE